MKLIDAMQGYLTEQSVKFFRAEGEDVIIVLLYQGDFYTLIQIFGDEAVQCLVVRADGGVFVPTDRREAATSYLMLANYGLKYGGFQMDPEDGEVFYQTSLIAPVGARLDLMKPLFEKAAATYVRFHHGLLTVVCQDADPRITAARIKGWRHDAASADEVNGIVDRLFETMEEPSLGHSAEPDPD